MGKVQSFSLFTDFDINLFKAGKHFRLYEKFGSHQVVLDGVKGTYFSVWAPTANQVSVIGDFNHWVDGEFKLNVRWDSSGIWEGFIPDVGKGNVYKYKIHSNNQGYISEKADPYARRCEHPPKTASVVWDDNYKWKDTNWMKTRKEHNSLKSPYSVYEVHCLVRLNQNLSLSQMLVSYWMLYHLLNENYLPHQEYNQDDYQ